MMSDPNHSSDKSSDAPRLVYCPKDKEYTVKCGKESCKKTTSMKLLLESCPLDVKEELHNHLGEVIASEKSTRVAYRANKVQLLAACSNVTTNTLMKVVEHRAYEMGDRSAQGVMRDIANAPIHNPTYDGEETPSDDVSEESNNSSDEK